MVLAKCQRARIRRMARDVVTGRVALEGEENFDFGVLRKCLRARRVDRTAVLVEPETALLPALQVAADIEHVLQHEVAGVDEELAALFCENRKRCQYRGGERFLDGTLLDGVA